MIEGFFITYSNPIHGFGHFSVIADRWQDFVKLADRFTAAGFVQVSERDYERAKEYWSRDKSQYSIPQKRTK